MTRRPTTRGAAGPPRRRAGLVALVVLGLVGVAAVALVTLSGMNDTLTYYKTPTEIDGNPPPSDESVRVGGLVTVGTVHHRGAVVRFVLTDGANDLDVVSRVAPPSTFRGGQGAVVQGHLLSDGAFRADQVVVRHSNEYRPPTTSAESRQ